MGRRKKSRTAAVSLSLVKPQMSIDDQQALNRRLFEIETDYFHQSENVNYSALMDEVVRKIVEPALKGLYNHMSFVGSSYELSAIPGTSDFDIQVFLKMPPGPGKRNIPKPTTGRIHECDRAGWRKIKGGPAHLLTSDGFLSAREVRKAYQSRIDAHLAAHGAASIYHKSESYTVSRTESGPATTLLIKKHDKIVTSIDVVACVSGGTISPKNRQIDLVAKPYTKSVPTDHEDCWRISCSKFERNLLRRTFTREPYFKTLTKITKLLKDNDAQLAQFKSYFYKNILLHLHKNRQSTSKWTTRGKLWLRFAESIQAIRQILDKGELPVFFNPEENILYKTSRSSYTSLLNHLDDVIGREAYIELLECVPKKK